MELGARGSAPKTPTPVMALSTQVHAEVWHRRLRHINSRNMELLRKKDDSGVDFTGTLSDCDICHINKNQQKAHPTKTVHETTRPVELVYTDLMGPMKPSAKEGYVHVSKFTDDFTSTKVIFLLKRKDQAVDCLRPYSQTVVVPLGLRTQHVRADKGTEYTSTYF